MHERAHLVADVQEQLRIGQRRVEPCEFEVLPQLCAQQRGQINGRVAADASPHLRQQALRVVEPVEELQGSDLVGQESWSVRRPQLVEDLEGAEMAAFVLGDFAQCV